jgi:hypothetical protein
MLHPNVYENLEEMHRRLHGTVVAYDGHPVYILAITNHKADGIFRLYVLPCEHSIRTELDRGMPGVDEFPAGYAQLGAMLDKYLEEHKDSPLMRKQANSPAFNKFRPFKLGMYNSAGRASYLERSPERRTQQGLIRQMVDQTHVDVNGVGRAGRFQDPLGGQSFVDCVKGNHPSAEECIENLLDPSDETRSVAFHRNFAFIRGPMDTFFLGYKTDVVGFVPPTKRPTVELGKKFAHLKEAIEETRQFSEIRIRQ